MDAGLVYAGRQPQGCAVGVPANSFSFRTSDPRVLREDSEEWLDGDFSGRAPGTVRVFAEGLPRAGRNATLSSCSICIDPSTYDDKNCALYAARHPRRAVTTATTPCSPPRSQLRSKAQLATIQSPDGEPHPPPRIEKS